jgi:hypothetical protein
MAYERLSDTKIRGDSLDSFIDGLVSLLKRQMSLRNAEDETRFLTSVVEENIPLEAQLAYRTDQLKRVSDDPEERKRVRAEISTLKDRIEQKKFADEYTDKLIGFESGLTSVDSVISWLTDQKARATDQTIIDSINKQLVEKQSQKFELSQKLIQNQVEYASRDKTNTILSDAINKVSTERSKALLSGNEELVSVYNLNLQALNRAKTESSIENDLRNFASASVTGYVSATGLLDTYNQKVASSQIDTPITIGDVTYASAKEYWTFKLPSGSSCKSAHQH